MSETWAAALSVGISVVGPHCRSPHSVSESGCRKRYRFVVRRRGCASITGTARARPIALKASGITRESGQPASRGTTAHPTADRVYACLNLHHLQGVVNGISNPIAVGPIRIGDTMVVVSYATVAAQFVEDC